MRRANAVVFLDQLVTASQEPPASASINSRMAIGRNSAHGSRRRAVIVSRICNGAGGVKRRTTSARHWVARGACLKIMEEVDKGVIPVMGELG